MVCDGVSPQARCGHDNRVSGILFIMPLVARKQVSCSQRCSGLRVADELAKAVVCTSSVEKWMSLAEIAVFFKWTTHELSIYYFPCIILNYNNYYFYMCVLDAERVRCQ